MRINERTFFIRDIAQSAPVAVAIICSAKSNYDQFGFARIGTNIKRFALKLARDARDAFPLGGSDANFVCLSGPRSLLTFSLCFFFVSVVLSFV